MATFPLFCPLIACVASAPREQLHKELKFRQTHANTEGNSPCQYRPSPLFTLTTINTPNTRLNTAQERPKHPSHETLPHPPRPAAGRGHRRRSLRFPRGNSRRFLDESAVSNVMQQLPASGASRFRDMVDLPSTIYGRLLSVLSPGAEARNLQAPVRGEQGPSVPTRTILPTAARPRRRWVWSTSRATDA